MKVKAFAVSLLLATSIAPAIAGNVYVLGSVGRTSIDEDKGVIDGDLLAAGVTGLSSSQDKHDTGYKLQLGYQFNPYFAVEGGYVDLGKEKYSATYTGGGANAEAKAQGWNLSALGILPLNDEFSLFAKLGMIDAKVDVDVTATALGTAASGSVSATKWKPNWGLGASYNLNKTVGVRLEYDQFQKLGDKNVTGESDVDMYSLGLEYKF